jgi:hypothetical protein
VVPDDGINKEEEFSLHVRLQFVDVMPSFQRLFIKGGVDAFTHQVIL